MSTTRKPHPRRIARLGITISAAVVGALIGAVALAPAGSADVPSTDDPPTYTQFPAVADPSSSAPDYFQPFWYDTDGRQIQAHGGDVVTATTAQLGIDQDDVQKADDNGTPVYYWYGEDRTNDYYDSPGVAVYSSHDLLNWTYEGDALRTVSSKSELTQPYFANLYATVTADGSTDTSKVDSLDHYLDVNQYGPDGTPQLSAIVERPKVLYNASTKKWVMWWHSDGSTTPGGSMYARSLAAVATSDSPIGPFQLQGAYRLYNRADYQACTPWAVPGQARDMTVFQDPDGTAYIVYSSEENASLYVAKLDSTFTNVERTTTSDTTGGQYSADGRYPHVLADGTSGAPVRGKDFQIVRECGGLEAPSVLEHGGKYYVIASGATGWAPNPQTYYTASSMLGGWIRGVEPDDASENASYSDIPDGGDGLLSVGDTARNTFGSQSANVLALPGGKYVYLGDRWDSGAADSTYVWLPLTFGENGRLELHNPATEAPGRWATGWDASYWDDKGTGDGTWSVVDDGLPETVEQGTDPASVLPRSVQVKVDDKVSDVAVTWAPLDTTTPGRKTVTGTLAAVGGFGTGRTFTRELTVWEYGMVDLALDATVTASSRGDLASTVVDGDTTSKGWDDWSSSGYPRDSWLSFAWPTSEHPSTIEVHTFKDGAGATWPSTVSVQYQDESGTWATSSVSTTLEQDPTSAAPVVALDVSSLPPSRGLRIRLQSATDTWQSVSEVEMWGPPGAGNLCSAHDATVTASFYQTDYASLPGADACDGDTSTAWSTWSSDDSGDEAPTLTVHTDAAHTLDSLSFTNTEGTIGTVSVDAKDAQGDWQPTTAQHIAPAANGQATSITFDPVTTTDLRLDVTTPGSYLKISELVVPVTASTSFCAQDAGTIVTDAFHQTLDGTMPAQNACDGSAKTSWSTWAPDDPHDQVTFTADAEGAYDVDHVSFSNSEGTLTGVSVAYRATDGTWRSTTATDQAPAANGETTTVAFSPVTATGLRITFTTPGSYLKIPELTIPATLAPAPLKGTATTAVVTRPTATFGRSATVKVTVKMKGKAPGTGAPTGTVQVTEGSTPVGSGTLANGKASITLASDLTVGKHRLTVSYPGDQFFTGSTKAVKVTVTKASSKTKVSVSPKVSTGADHVVVTAKVVTAEPSGSVVVKVEHTVSTTVVRKGKNVTTSRTRTVASQKVALSDDGVATLQLPQLAQGRYEVAVTYPGSATATGSSASTMITVRP